MYIERDAQFVSLQESKTHSQSGCGVVGLQYSARDTAGFWGGRLQRLTASQQTKAATQQVISRRQHRAGDAY